MDEMVQFRHVFWKEEVKILKKESWNNMIDSKFMEEDGASKWTYVLR